MIRNIYLISNHKNYKAFYIIWAEKKSNIFFLLLIMITPGTTIISCLNFNISVCLLIIYRFFLKYIIFVCCNTSFISYISVYVFIIISSSEFLTYRLIYIYHKKIIMMIMSILSTAHLVQRPFFLYQ